MAEINPYTEKVETEGLQEELSFTISEGSAPLIMDALINLYSDPCGSIVRELASNGIDAIREKQQKLEGLRELEPGEDVRYFSSDCFVRINITEELFTNNHSISFKDCGVGLSPDRVKKVFTTFGQSTKRDGNVEIGGYGIGAKSPFAYTDNFIICTVFNGTKTSYLVYRGDRAPMMSVMSTEPTEELNSTTIIIPIKSESDIFLFKTKIHEQLKAFKNILLNDEPIYVLDNKIVIEDEHFYLTRNLLNIEVLVGNVIYPLDFKLLRQYHADKLHVTRIFKSKTISVTFTNLTSSWVQFPNCLTPRIKIGEVDLIPSREALRYTEKTQTVLVKKLELALFRVSDLVIEALQLSTDVELLLFILKYPFLTYFDIKIASKINELNIHYIIPKAIIEIENSMGGRVLKSLEKLRVRTGKPKLSVVSKQNYGYCVIPKFVYVWDTDIETYKHEFLFLLQTKEYDGVSILLFEKQFEENPLIQKFCADENTISFVDVATAYIETRKSDYEKWVEDYTYVPVKTKDNTLVTFKQILLVNGIYTDYNYNFYSSVKIDNTTIDNLTDCIYGTSDDRMLLYLASVIKLQKKTLYKPGMRSNVILVSQTLKNQLESEGLGQHVEDFLADSQKELQIYFTALVLHWSISYDLNRSNHTVTSLKFKKLYEYTSSVHLEFGKSESNFIEFQLACLDKMQDLKLLDYSMLELLEEILKPTDKTHLDKEALNIPIFTQKPLIYGLH